MNTPDLPVYKGTSAVCGHCGIYFDDKDRLEVVVEVTLEGKYSKHDIAFCKKGVVASADDCIAKWRRQYKKSSASTEMIFSAKFLLEYGGIKERCDVCGKGFVFGKVMLIESRRKIALCISRKPFFENDCSKKWMEKNGTPSMMLATERRRYHGNT